MAHIRPPIATTIAASAPSAPRYLNRSPFPRSSNPFNAHEMSRIAAPNERMTSARPPNFNVPSSLNLTRTAAIAPKIALTAKITPTADQRLS